MKVDARKSLSQCRTIGRKVSFEIFYWDVATMDDEIKLTLTLSPSTAQSVNNSNVLSMSNIASAYATSFVNRAIATVPEWNGAEVNWHGVLPLR